MKSNRKREEKWNCWISILGLKFLCINYSLISNICFLSYFQKCLFFYITINWIKLGWLLSKKNDSLKSETPDYILLCYLENFRSILKEHLIGICFFFFMKSMYKSKMANRFNGKLYLIQSVTIFIFFIVHGWQRNRLMKGMFCLFFFLNGNLILINQWDWCKSLNVPSVLFLPSSYPAIHFLLLLMLFILSIFCTCEMKYWLNCSYILNAKIYVDSFFHSWLIKYNFFFWGGRRKGFLFHN